MEWKGRGKGMKKKINFDIVKRFWKWNGTGIWNKEKFGLSLKMDGIES